MTKSHSPFTLVLKELWDFVVGGFRYSPPSTYAPVRLIPGQHYGATDTDTSRIRLLLTGQYTEGMLVRPLQPSEVATFMLREYGYAVPDVALAWLPGQWHMKLKGASDVHVSVLPKAETVIEYFDADGVGHLGVVTNVAADENITFVTIDTERPGVLQTKTAEKTTWQALGPVFTKLPKPLV
jgi:hypothetical protein